MDFWFGIQVPWRLINKAGNEMQCQHSIKLFSFADNWTFYCFKTSSEKGASMVNATEPLCWLSSIWPWNCNVENAIFSVHSTWTFCCFTMKWFETFWTRTMNSISSHKHLDMLESLGLLEVPVTWHEKRLAQILQ